MPASLDLRLLAPFGHNPALVNPPDSENSVVRRVDFLKRRIPMLKELLADEEIGDFFRYVRENGLRGRALETLDAKLKSPAIVLPLNRR